MQESSVLDVSAEPEVHELGVGAAAPAEQNIFQLDVTVHDVGSVHVLHLRQQQQQQQSRSCM